MGYTTSGIEGESDCVQTPEQHDTDIIKLARAAIERWANFARGTDADVLFYPSQTVEQRAVFGHRDGPGTPTGWPTDVQFIEDTILTMPLPWRHAIVLHFVRRRSYRETARELHCTKHLIEQWIDYSLAFVAARL